MDLYVIPLSGAELVLGVQWLKTLGSVLTDYNNLTMSFHQNGQVTRISGHPIPSPTDVSMHQLKRLVSTQALDTILQFHLLPYPHNDEPPHQTQPELDNLLTKYSTLFENPTHLPPQRPTDHQILLLHGKDPVNIMSYHYPQFQKQEIDAQIHDMLSQGIIQPSSSSFSSPVLLVRKKGGTCRFCVDYRALNAITIKDRFPIPAIDELLDEFHGTK